MSNGSFSHFKGSDRMGVTTTTAPREKSAAAKKVNKWDAVMSKINYETKSKPTPALALALAPAPASASTTLPLPSTTTIIPGAPRELKPRAFQTLSVVQKLVRQANNQTLDNSTSSVRHRQITHLRNERNNSSTASTTTAATTASTNTNNVRSNSNSLLIDNHENDRYSVQSSTESESSLQESSGTSSIIRTRVKKTTGTSYRQTSDLSSASDNSASQRRMIRPVMTTNKGTSRLATTNLASTTSSHSTNQIAPRPDRRKPQSIPSTSPNAGCKTVPSKVPFSRTAALHLKPLRDRNRMGPDGKSVTTDSEGHVSSTTLPSITGNNNQSHKSQNGLIPNQVVNRPNGASLANPPVTSTNLIVDNTNNNAPTTPCSNTAALTLENSRLKDELSLQYGLIADLKNQLELSNSCLSTAKNNMEAQVKTSNQRFLATIITAQKFDFERTTLEKKLLEERTLDQQREDQLALERLEEIQNLRVEFERERECIQEELAVMRKTDESQVEKLKELGVELSKKEELLSECEDEKLKLKRKYEEELVAIKDKYREEEEVKYQVIKRTLSSPPPANTTTELLHKEISSLQVVIEMRNEEIRSLRQDLLTQKSFLEDLSSCKEQNKALLAKVEDLNAQLVKSRFDKHDMQKKHQEAEDNAAQALGQVNQLQYENEQLRWRLQSIKTDARVSELMSKSAVQLGCDTHISLDYQAAMNSLLDPNIRLDVDITSPNGCVKQ